ncbi:MAG: hypothetical protein WEA34_12255 [Gemmatimonadota bacterium]
MSGMSPRRDESLPLFQRPAPPAVARWPEPELAVAVASSSLPVRLDGERATVLGTVRGPWDEIRFGPAPAVAGLAWGDDPVANAVVSPGLLRRERVGRAASWEETVLVAPGLPLVVLGTGSERSGPPALTLTALPDTTAVRYRTRGGAVTLAGPDPDTMLALVAHPDSCAWSVAPAPSGGVALRCSSEEGISSLALAYGSEAAIRGALSGTRHLAGHALRAGARADDDLLALTTGAYELDQAVAWMERRLGSGIDSALGRPSGTGAPGERDAWLWAGLGAAAVGDHERARRCASMLERLGRPDAAAFLQARTALADGRTDGLMDTAERSLAATDAEDPALRRLGLRSAADALRYAATDTALERLRAAGGGVEAGSTGTGRSGPADDATAAGKGVRLPTLGGPLSSLPGGPPAATPGTWLSHILEGPRDRPSPKPTDGEDGEQVARALRAWGTMASPGDGWNSWRGMVAEGLDSGTRGVGCWDPIDPTAPPAVAGILLAAMAFGWLGAFPDAPVGRLALKPRIPERVRSFRFEGVTIGDVTLTLAYAREGSTHRFDLDPQRGRVPSLVVFETLVPGETARVTIDGAPAELDTTPSGAGVTVRLQTPLDATRRIEIETTSAASS